MTRTKYAVFVSGGGTNLQALIDAERAGKIPSGEIALVLSNRKDAYALQRAQAAGIPAVAVSRKRAGSQAAFEAELDRLVRDAGCGLIVLAGFLSILSGDFTAKWENRIINIHPSLIPSFCGEGYYGLRVHEAALARGVRVTGATVHYVNEIPDGGKILLQKSVAIRANDTAESLQMRVMQQAEWKILPRAAEIVCRKIAKESEHEQF